MTRIEADLDAGFIGPNNIPPLLNSPILMLQCPLETCDYVLRCEMWFGTSNTLIDTKFFEATLNGSLGDVEADIVGNFLERHASKL